MRGFCVRCLFLYLCLIHCCLCKINKIDDHNNRNNIDSSFWIDQIQKSPEDSKHLDIIGIFSICSNSDILTDFNKKAFAIHMGILYGIYDGSSLENNFNFKTFDVCNDTGLLTKLLVQLILDESYQLTKSTTYISRIFCIFVYLPEAMEKLTANILLPYQLPLISLSDYSIFPDRPNSHPLYLPYGQFSKRDTNYYLRLFDAYKFQYVTIVSLNSTHETHQLYEYLNKAILKRADMCFITVIAETTSERLDLLKRLANDKMLQVVLILGDHDNIVELYTDYLILSEDEEEMTERTIILNFQGDLYHKKQTLNLLKLLHRLDRNNLTDAFLHHHPNIVHGVYSESYIIFEMMEIMIGLENYANYGDINNKKPKEIFDSFEKYVLSSSDRSKNNKDLFTNALKQPPLTRCSNFSCKAGWEKEIVRNESSAWQNEYSYICSKCKHNFIKALEGTEKCKQCLGKSTSDIDHKNCFVPYKDKTINIKQIGTIVSITINIIGILGSLLTFIVFVKYRKTPIVRASDIQLSNVQILTIMSAFTLLPYFLLVKKTILICSVKPVIIGICYTFIVGIIIVKAQKPLGAFLSKKKLSRRAIKVTTVQQYFILILTLIISALIAFVCCRKIPPRIIQLLNDEQLTRIEYCNTDDHLHMQLVYLFVLLVASLIQAFRCRKIPKNYSEAMNIVYSTFACCICLIVLPPLYYSQIDIFNKLRVHWIVLSSMNLVLLLALYGPKVYVIIFLPKLNSPAEFRRSALNNMHKDVELRSSRRHSKISVRKSTSNGTVSSSVQGGSMRLLSDISSGFTVTSPKDKLKNEHNLLINSVSCESTFSTILP